MELRIIEHHNPTLHWHVQWVADGDRALVYAEGCFGYSSYEKAEAARDELLRIEASEDAEVLSR